MENFIDIQLNSKLYFSEHIIKPDYDICYSNFIDDSYWNYAYLKNNNIDFTLTFQSIINDLHCLRRTPTLYVTSDILNSELNKYIEDNHFQLLYTDSWLVLNDISKFPSFKSPLSFTTRKVDIAASNKFIDAVMIGFSGDNPDDPYESLSDGYRTSLEKSFYSDDNNYRIIHYLGEKNGEVISTASVVYKDNSAILYNITTNKKYQKLGVCKQMMSDIITKLKSFGIDKICVQTEKDYYPEKIYQNFGFKKAILGKAYKLEE